MAILDTLSSTYGVSAEVAHSLRKIENDYAGSCIRIRRDSDNGETDIGFSGSDLDTSAISTHCGANNGFVVTWYDQTTTGLNVSGIADTNEPKIYDSSTGLLTDSNGNPKMTLDGSNDYLKASATITVANNLTVSLVIKPSGTQSSFAKVVGAYQFNNGGWFIEQIDSNLNIYKWNTQKSSFEALEFSSSIGTDHQILTLLKNGTAGVAYKNISTQVMNDTIASGTVDQGTKFYQIGNNNDSSAVWSGDMQEVIVFNSELSSSARSDLENDQDGYWINPPSGIEITHSTGVFNFTTTTHSIAVTSSGAVNHSAGIFNFPTTTHSIFGANNIEITHSTGVFNFPTTTHSVDVTLNVFIGHTAGVFNFPTTTHSIEGGGSIEITHTTGVFNFPTTTHSIAMSDNIFITHTTGVLNFPTTTHSIAVTENVFITHTSGVFNFPTTTHLITTVDGIDIAHTSGVFNFPTTTVRVGVLPDYDVWSNRQSILFGGENDTRVFLYGNNNKYIYSELADGLPSAEYFPASNSVLVSSDNYDITAMTKQYDRLTVHKENESHYVTYENNATLGTIFSVFPLNDSIGNVAFGEARLIQNNPFVVADGVYEFTGSNVRDERNATLVSRNVQLGLNNLTLSNAVTFDWERNFEYFLAIATTVYVFNYKVNAWYKYTLNDTPTCFIEIGGECYFGTSTGAIMKFDTTKLTDNGTLITANWETGYIDFGANWIRKFLTYGWFHLEPEGRSQCYIDWISDQGSSTTSYELKLNNLDFSNIDFSDFSFNTNYSPKPFRKKLKAKKFSMIKLLGKNEETTTKMTILGISLNATTGGQVK